MQGSVNKEYMNRLATTALGEITIELVQELVSSIDDDIYADLEKAW